MEEALSKMASNAGTLPIAYCRIAYIAALPIAYISDFDAACGKLEVMLPIAYCLLLIVMEHGRRFVGNGK